MTNSGFPQWFEHVDLPTYKFVPMFAPDSARDMEMQILSPTIETSGALALKSLGNRNLSGFPIEDVHNRAYISASCG
jgi:hypothetical protein